MQTIQRLTRLLSITALAAVIAACSWTPGNFTDSYKDVLYAPSDFDSLPNVDDEYWAPALRAFRLSCETIGSKRIWEDACSRAQLATDAEAKQFFASNFEPWRAARDAGGDLQAKGLMTGYYEPELIGSLTPSQRFSTPILGVPPDLITVDLTELHPQLKGLKLRGKVVGQTLIPYDARSGIVNRADLNKSAICWVEDPVEAFFLQIQGSGRIRLPDGSHVRVGYADTNGHPYRALGRWLIDYAGLKPEEMSMQRIKAWAEEHPRKVNAMLNYNPSYVFFTERVGFTDEQGPIGAQGVPLTSQASVAVDRRYWTLGTPLVLSTMQLLPPMAFTRPVIAQDTGGAIRGPLRFDFFWGYGDEAGSLAGRQKSDTKVWVLVPRGYTPSQLRE